MNVLIFYEMGGNGSTKSGTSATEAGREYRTIFSIGSNIKVIQRKNFKLSVKLPEESHTPNRIYAVFKKDGSNLKEFAVYGSDCKKLYEVHLQEHNGIYPHVHFWKNGKPIGGTNYALPLTKEMQHLLYQITHPK